MRNFRINTLNAWRRLLLLPLWFGMRVWTRTLRFELEADDEAALRDISSPMVCLIWHNRILVSAEIYRRYRLGRKMCALISTSKDGAWLSAFFELNGMRAVRGSSSRGGREAILDMAARLKEGDDLAITPDGPRGPMYSFKPGPAIIIRKSGAPALLCGFAFSSAWRLNSWDRLVLPAPFSKIRISCRTIKAADLPEDFSRCTEVLRNTLAGLNGE